MPNQDYYQGYYDYFSPGGGSKLRDLYDTWGDIYKYQQDPSQLTGDPLKTAEWWVRQNAGQHYAAPWNFASTHYNLYPTGGHANKYNAYLQARGGGDGDGNGDDDKTDFSPNYPAGMPAGYKPYLKQWGKLRAKANLPGAAGFGRDLKQWNQLRSTANLPGVEGFDRDVGMWQDMGGRWDQAQSQLEGEWRQALSQADVDIEDVANYAARLRGVEEPLYAKQIRGERLGLENRLLSQGMLGSTGGASRAEALYNAQAQAAAVRDASRYQRAEGMQQQNYQNLLAALQGGQSATLAGLQGSQSALAGQSAARQAQLGYHQQNFANQLASLTGVGTARKAQQDYYQQNFANQLARLTGAGGLFTGIHNIATDRGLGGTKGLIDLLRALQGGG